MKTTKLAYYLVKVKRPSPMNSLTIGFSASSKADAKKIIMEIEGCPASAILEIRKVVPREYK